MNSLNRRHFLKAGSVSAASTMLNLQMAGTAAAANNGDGDDRKTLVAIDFDGGLDAFHLLMPRDPDRHAVYARSRSNLHIPIEGSLGTYRQAMLPLLEEDGGNGSDFYGVHSETQGIADMFNGTGDFVGNRCASFIGNVGTLIKPLTVDEFFNGQTGVDIPVGVGGHFGQSEQWQTAIPQGTKDLRGWLGRAGDLMQGTYNRDGSSMSLSLAGNNVLQSGKVIRPLSYNPFLSGGLSRGHGRLNELKNLFHRRVMDQTHESFVDKTFGDITNISLDRQDALRTSVTAFDDDILIERFGPNHGGFRDALILIYNREKLGLCRQTIFMSIPGWDNHFEVVETFHNQIANVSEGLRIFQRNLVHLGLDDSVISFSTSEFARTLRSTGAGSDHAWGGPQFIVGGPVQGGKVFGQYPELGLRGGQNVGRGGRLLPFHSCDEYFVEMLRWFGVTEDQLDIVLPNFNKYFGDRNPIGYLKA